MKPPVCDSPFEVAFWLIHRAKEDGEYLQPQKLHRLMYLAQAYYGALTRGQKLMPALFVCSAFGPIEPSTFRAFESGPPKFAIQPVPEQAKHFLDSLWRRFGAHSGDYLTKMTTNHPPYVEAMTLGNRVEISFASMMSYYNRRPKAEDGDRTGAPSLDNVLRPRVMRSHKGKPVNVHSWMPTKVMKTTQSRDD